MKQIKIYVDGTFSKTTGIGGWAFIAIENNSIICKFNGKITDPKELVGWQINAEIRAVIEALTFCKNNNYKALIYHDLINLKKWVGDLFGEKPWKTNQRYTKSYRNFVLNHKEHILNFKKVKAHSGDKYNEMVDKLTKKDAEIQQLFDFFENIT